MSASELFKAGKLTEALEAVVSHVKSKPTDIEQRLFFAELLCFANQFERADKQLEAITQQTTKAPVTIALYRQILRGEIAREQVLREGRSPELLGELPGYAQKTLEALVADRLNQAEDAAKLIADAEVDRPNFSGRINGKEFKGFRDLDDRVAGVIEVITSSGKYYWVPMNTIESMEMQKPSVPFDLLWRRTQIDVKGGPQGEVFIPTRYVPPIDETDDAINLGRATDWSEPEAPIIAGRGQRCFAVDDDEVTILEISSLEFDIAAG